MNAYATAFADAWTIISESPLFPLLIYGLSLSLMFSVFRMILSMLDVRPGSFNLFGDFFRWLGGKIVTWMCSSEKGFKLAYKLGWARQGVDFFDCGQDCDKCPKYSTCDSFLRTDLVDVRQKQDPGAGSCS